MKKIATMVLAGVLATVPVSTTGASGNFRMEQIHRISSGQPERKLQQTQMKAKG
ncbi:hypothetical protein M5E86_13645 [Blautia wexlerae]|nr:hypothetical protein M5E86_13645 [Blautia wexlerae]